MAYIGTAARYWLGSRGICVPYQTGQETFFSKTIGPVLGLIQYPIQWEQIGTGICWYSS